MHTPDPFDAPLLPVSEGDALSCRDLTQHVFVIGATGSGKSSGTGRHSFEMLATSGEWGQSHTHQQEHDRGFYR